MMKVLLPVLFLLSACSSGQKISEVSTDLENKKNLGGGETVGKNSDGKVVVQKKEKLVNYLMELQRDVYSSEQEIYGNATYGNKGKYGVLEDCRVALRAKASGKWEMPEPIERVLITEDESKITKTVGIDEKGELVLLQEEDILARIKRFERYKRTYGQQNLWFDTEIKNCKVQLNNYTEKPKDKPETFPDLKEVKKADLNQWLCQTVEMEYPLSKIVTEAIANGWLYEVDLVDMEYVNDLTSTDSSKFKRNNVLKIDQWVLAFDRPANYGALRNKEAEAYLKAWYHPNPDIIANNTACLPNKKIWNTSRR
ncbi:MAG: hypothetical protein ACLGGX_03305 [Bdellovibrionia bacterium]